MMAKADVGARLREARKAKGLSREAVAERLGYKSVGAIQHHENGEREPNIDTLAAYSRIYGVTVDWIVTGRPSARDEIVDLLEAMDDRRREQLMAIVRTFKAG